MAKQYKARDRTVQKMGRDGLEEVNLHTQESRRISKKVVENGRLGKRAGDGDALPNEGMQTGEQGRRRKRGRGRKGRGHIESDAGNIADTLNEDWLDGEENQADTRRYSLGNMDGISVNGGGTDFHQERPPLREYSSRAREFAASDDGHRYSRRAKSYVFGGQRGRADEKKSVYAAKDKTVKNLSEGYEGKTAGRKHLQRDRYKKDKLFRYGDAVTGAVSTGNDLAGDGTGYSKQSQTDETVQEMYGRLAYAGRNMSYRLHHRREKNGSRFSSKLRSEAAAENPIGRTTMENRRQADMQIADGVLNRREDRQMNASHALRSRQERLALRNAGNRETPLHADMIARKQKNRRVQKAIQKRKYQKAYVEAVRNGVPASSIVDRLKSMTGVQENFASWVVNRKRQQGMLVFGIAKNKAAAATAVILTCVVLLLSILSFAGIVFDSGMMVIAATTYQSTDEEIHSVEDAYLALENALDRQINGMESTHPGYDEYRYQVDEIAHNPFQLISYLTVAYGEFTLADVEEVLRELFDEQYTLWVWEEVETRTRTVTDPDTGEETEEEYDCYILNISLTNRGFDTVARERMTEDQIKLYEVYNSTFGNRQYLFDETTIPDSGATGGGAEYEIPPEALSDERFARMINEAEKYLGYPYVWGGSSPSTSFDCSGFVSWVINNSGNGWSVGRQTANGLRGLCSYVSPEEARPGDLIFFQGTYNTSGASHVGIVVGDGVMIHCGDPIQYANYANSSYWQSHFLSFGRLP